MWYTYILTEKIKSAKTVTVICRVLNNRTDCTTLQDGIIYKSREPFRSRGGETPWKLLLHSLSLYWQVLLATLSANGWKGTNKRRQPKV